jgi:hypothetical protein
MITVIVDDQRFTLSTQTLNQNPRFIITQILKKTVPADANPYVTRINETTFEIDMDPGEFRQIVQELRKEPRILFTDQNRSGSLPGGPGHVPGSIFQKTIKESEIKPKDLPDVSKIHALFKQGAGVRTEDNESSTNLSAIGSGLTESVPGSGKTHYVLKPRKIELDTSENKS